MSKPTKSDAAMLALANADQLEEVAYCATLCRTRGNAQVGLSAGAVASYLRVQAASATRRAYPAHAIALSDAAGLCSAGNLEAAHKLLTGLLEGEAR